MLSIRCSVKTALKTSMALPDPLRQHLQAEGFDVASIEQELCRQHGMQDDLPLPLRRVLADQHDHTWFVLPSDGDFVPHRTWRGSRPGSPLADIVYNHLMTALLRAARVLLDNDPTVVEAEARMPQKIPLVTSVDDLAIPLLAKSAREVPVMLQRLVPALDATLRSFGLTLNFSRSKSEAVLQLRGRGAPETRAALFFEEFGQLDLSAGARLRLSATHVHLGITFAQSYSLQAEIEGRLNKAQAAFRMMTRTIFQNKYLAIPLKLQLLESFVLPIFFYGSGAWSLLTPGQYRKIDQTILSWQRRIAHKPRCPDSRITDAAFRAKFALPALLVRLAKHRLLFALKLFTHGHGDLQALLFAEDAKCEGVWIEALRHCLRWLRSETPGHALLSSELTPQDIRKWPQAAPHHEARNVRALVRRTCLQERAIHEIEETCVDIHRLYQQHGVWMRSPSLEVLPTAASHRCSVCAKAFASIQALCAHQWRAHGLRSKERSFMDSATCRACGQHFWSLQRLQQHLKRTQQRPDGGCYLHLARHMDPIEDVQRVQQETPGIPDHLCHLERLPAQPIFGPWQLPSSTAWERSQATIHEALTRAWQVWNYPPTLDADLDAAVAWELTGFTRHWVQRHGHVDPSESSRAYERLALLQTPDEMTMHQRDRAFLRWGQNDCYSLAEEFEAPEFVTYLETEFLTWTAAAFRHVSPRNSSGHRD